MARVTFEQVTEDREIRSALVGYLPAAAPSRPSESIRYRPCPACQRFMNRMNYGRISGVIVDVCKEDGIWFDSDELRRVLDFIQAGGLEKARERQIQELEAAKRMPRPGGAFEHPASSSEWSQSQSARGSVVADLAFELFDLLRR